MRLACTRWSGASAAYSWSSACRSRPCHACLPACVPRRQSCASTASRRPLLPKASRGCRQTTATKTGTAPALATACETRTRSAATYPARRTLLRRRGAGASTPPCRRRRTFAMRATSQATGSRRARRRRGVQEAPGATGRTARCHRPRMCATCATNRATGFSTARTRRPRFVCGRGSWGLPPRQVLVGCGAAIVIHDARVVWLVPDGDPALFPSWTGHVQNSVPPRSYICRICRKPGHYITDCPESGGGGSSAGGRVSHRPPPAPLERRSAPRKRRWGDDSR